MNSNLKQAFVQWIPFAIVLTFVCALIYGVGQQVIRQSADDMQVQMAEDAASQLASGQKPDSVIPAKKVDMVKSLAPFIIVYNDKQQVIASSGSINGKVPLLPGGVLDAAKDGENHITWQPEANVRDAVVALSFHGKQSGYVLAGRSLREVEKHSNLVFILTFFTWVASLIVMYIYFLFTALVREQVHAEKIKQFTIFKNKKR